MTDHPTDCIVAVVDDDARILESLEGLLESADYVVRAFSSGSALLESGDVATIDCLISDIGMSGMDGFELTRAIQAVRPDLPIIFITGQADMLNRAAPIGFGGHRLFKKPFDGEQLLLAVSDALR